MKAAKVVENGMWSIRNDCQNVVVEKCFKLLFIFAAIAFLESLFQMFATRYAKELTPRIHNAGGFAILFHASAILGLHGDPGFDEWKSRAR